MDSSALLSARTSAAKWTFRRRFVSFPPSKQRVPATSVPQVLTHERFRTELIAVITHHHRVKSCVLFFRNKQSVPEGTVAPSLTKPAFISLIFSGRDLLSVHSFSPCETRLSVPVFFVRPQPPDVVLILLQSAVGVALWPFPVLLPSNCHLFFWISDNCPDLFKNTHTHLQP